LAAGPGRRRAVHRADRYRRGRCRRADTVGRAHGRGPRPTRPGPARPSLGGGRRPGHAVDRTGASGRCRYGERGAGRRIGRTPGPCRPSSTGGCGPVSERSDQSVQGPRAPFVVAHRGASAARPEHTLAAYELALEEGADGLECDVRLTRDGHLVCVHDRTVDRTSSGTGLVSELTLAELKELDFGDGSPAGVLTLSELIGLVLDWRSRPTKLFIETKHPVR